MKKLVVMWLAFGMVSSATLEAKAPKAQSGQGGSKQLDFDGDVVEGMNRQPLDSLTSVNEGDGANGRKNLYRRKKKVKQDNRELAREIFETY